MCSSHYSVTKFITMGKPTSLSRNQFVSKNCAGIASEVWKTMKIANRGHVPAYGGDAWTDRAAGLTRRDPR
jgi:hypothetical protein